MEGSVGGGRYDIHLTDDRGDDYVIELKLVPAKELAPPEEKGKPEGRALTKEAKEALEKKLRERNDKKIADALEAAMSQIENKNYTQKFQGTGRNIWKTALVFSGYELLRAEYRKAPNWSLKMDPKGGFKVVLTAGG